MINLYLTDTNYNVFNVLCDLLKNKVNRLDGRNLVFCEEKVSLMVERTICARYGGTFNTEVYSFGNFLRLHKKAEKVLSKEGSAMVVKRVLSTASLNLFRNSATTLASSLFELIIQLKSASVTPLDLINASQKTGGVLKNKLVDIATVFESYEQYLKDNGFEDQSSMLDYLPPLFEQTPSLENADVFLVGYSAFTKQAKEAIRTLLRKAKSVTAVLVEGENHFAYLNETAEIFKKLCKEENLNLHIEQIKTDCACENQVIVKSLFNPLFKSDKTQTQKIYGLTAKNVNEEIERLASVIKADVLAGKIRYRDASVALCDSGLYKEEIKSCFDLLEVPYFLDEKKKPDNHPLVSLVINYIDIFRKGFEKTLVSSFVKNPLFCQDKTLADDFINYLKRNNLFYSGLKEKFDFSAKNPSQLEQFEGLREKFIRLFERFDFNFLFDQLSVRENLEQFSQQLKEAGEYDESAVNEQILDAILKILGEIDLLLGGVKLSLIELKRIFLSGISALELSIIPQYNDAVFIGGFKEASLYPAKYLFVPGLTSAVPNAKDDVALLSDGDIDALENVKVMIEPKIKVVNHRERENVALGISAFTDKLFLSYPLTAKDGKKNAKSEVYDSLSKLFAIQDFPKADGYYTKKQGKMTFAKACSDFYDGKICDFTEPSSYFELCKDKKELVGFAERSGKQVKIKLEKNQRAVVNNVSSPTAIEEYYKCPYRAFLSRSLRIKESDEGEVNALSYGTFMHAVFAEYLARINEVKDIESSNALVEEICARLFIQDEYKRFTKDEGFSADLQRNVQECKKFCYKTFASKSNSQFSTDSGDVEAPFGRKPKNDGKNYYPAITLADGKVKLTGVIDRIDTFGDYYRIVDYKTGSADASSEKLFTGLKLQLYLYAAAVGKSNPDKKLAGLYYLPVHDEFSTEKNKNKPLFVGKTLNDKDLITSQDKSLECGEKGQFLPIEIKDGAFKNVSSKENLQAMVDYALLLSENAVSQMVDGVIVASPYERACGYCPYRSLCGREEENGRKVKTVHDEHFYFAIQETKEGGNEIDTATIEANLNEKTVDEIKKEEK